MRYCWHHSLLPKQADLILIIYVTSCKDGQTVCAFQKNDLTNWWTRDYFSAGCLGEPDPCLFLFPPNCQYSLHKIHYMVPSTHRISYSSRKTSSKFSSLNLETIVSFRIWMLFWLEIWNVLEKGDLWVNVASQFLTWKLFFIPQFWYLLFVLKCFA